MALLIRSMCWNSHDFYVKCHYVLLSNIFNLFLQYNVHQITLHFHLVNCNSLELHFNNQAKKRKCLVSGYPTDPNILGPTQTFFKTFGILKSNFRQFLRIFKLFPYKEVFIKKSLPTYRP